MENDLERTSVTTQQGSGEPPDEKSEQYKRQARGKYRKLMVQLEFRCHRAAKMNYHDASCYSPNMYRMEFMAASLGTVSLTTIGTWFLQNQIDTWFSNISQLGIVWILAVAAAIIFNLLSIVCTRISPSFSRMADTHVTAAAAWQALAHTTTSYRIKLDDPKFDVHEYAQWYRDLITERKKICSMGSILQSTYDKFNDPDRVLEPLKKRKESFTKYLVCEGIDEGYFLGKKIAVGTNDKKDS